jgi:hypothetical protein
LDEQVVKNTAHASMSTAMMRETSNDGRFILCLSYEKNLDMAALLTNNQK